MSERLSELGPLVVGAINQVLCPLADTECGDIVGGIVLIWLKEGCCEVKRVEVAFAQAPVGLEKPNGVDHGQKIDRVTLHEPSWQHRLIIEPQGITPEGLAALRDILGDLLPATTDDGPIYTGEPLRHPRALIVPFARFSRTLPRSLPMITIGERTIRLFDDLVDASIGDIARFVQLQVFNGIRTRGPLPQQAAQVLAGYRPDPRALRRWAAGSYLAACIRRATETDWASSHLFELIDDLSRMRHEHAAVAGNLAFVSQRVADEVCTVRLHKDVLSWVGDAARFGQPIVSEMRIVRKLLHGTNPQWLLVVSDGIPMGWAPREALLYSPEAVVISFKRPGKWHVRYRDIEFLAVIDGQVQRAADVSPCLLVENALRQVRHLPVTWNNAYITDVTARVAEAEHGALLVFMDGAAEYVHSHQHSCISVEPVRLDPELVATAAMMDGAMIFDPAGVCYAIAAILDGASCPNERIDRGARYNAALRFCAGFESALCIVTSDDGLINVIPGRSGRSSANTKRH